MFKPAASTAASHPSPPRAHHVLVDFENVQEIDLSVIGRKSVSFTLFVGARQTKLSAALVEKLMAHADSVQLVRLQSSGRNALDFTLAYYLGRAVTADPTGEFHIVSGDTGFDPLIDHLRSRHLQVRRHDDCTTLPGAAPAKPAGQPPKQPDEPVKAAKPARSSKSSEHPKPPMSKPPLAKQPDLLGLNAVSGLTEIEKQVLEHLRRSGHSRPKKSRTLVSHLKAFCESKAFETNVDDLIASLRRAGHLSIGERDVVTYHF